TGLRPASRRDGRARLGTPTPFRGLPPDPLARRDAAGAPDRPDGGGRRGPGHRPVLPAGPAQPRWRLGRSGRERLTRVDPGGAVAPAVRATGADADRLYDQEGRYPVEDRRLARADPRGAHGGEPGDQEPEQGGRGPADRHPDPE